MPIDKDSLSDLFEVRQDTSECSPNSLILNFNEGEVGVTMRVTFHERLGLSRMEVTSIITFPEERRGGGFATKAGGLLINWATSSGVDIVLAVDVWPSAEKLCEKGGFERVGNTNDFCLDIST